MATNSEKLQVRSIDTEESPFGAEMKSLFSNMLLPDLKRFANPLLDTLKEFQYIPVSEKDATEPMAIANMRMPHTKKADIVSFMQIFFTPENIHYFLSTLPSRTLNLFLAIADNHYLTDKMAASIYGKPVVIKERYWSSKVIDELSPFVLCKSKYEWDYQVDRDYILSFKEKALYTLILSSLINADHNTQPTLEGLSIFNGENSIFQDLPFVLSLYESGKLKVGSTKLLTKPVERAIAKLPMTDFVIQSDKESQSYCSRRYFVPIQYALYADDEGVDSMQALEDVIKEIIIRNSSSLITCFEKMYLPYIKGLGTDCLSWTGRFNLLQDLDYFFIGKDSQEWLSVQKLCLHLRTQSDSPSNAEGDYLLIDHYKMNRLHMENVYTGKPISFTEQIHQISDAAVKSMLFALASWGVLEIAYEPTMPKEATSPFDALRYVRLTALGRYVYGRDKEYTPPIAVNQDNPFELADDRLLIKVLNPASPRLFLIEQFAQPVAPTLYKVDEKQFLHEVNTKTELEIKIKLFKRTFGKSLPQVWTDFFDDLLMRCEAFTTPGKAYVIRRVNKADRRLQEIILSDPRLKSFVVRAEGYLILIERSQVLEFDKIMREYGYLL